MLFKRPPRNRCFDRQRVLEVKVRAAELRQRRFRVVLLLLALAFSVGVFLFVGSRGAEWALNELVFTNDAFAVAVLDVQTDGVLPVDQLRRMCGVRPGDNLLALDLRRIKRDLELSPLVRSAAVERVLPHTLRIRVTEREPVARVNVLQPRTSGAGLEAVTYFLDETGFVMFPLGRGRRGGPPFQAEAELPLLRGVAPGELHPGRVVEAPRIQAALRFLGEFERSPLAGCVELKSLDLSAPETMDATTGQGSVVTIALRRFDEQLRYWEALLEHGRQTAKVVATLDLSITNNLPVTWLEASAAPPAPAKPLKPSRSRKKQKHV
jgi:cell division septal protein FtsQ